uniref:Ankyrin repeat protein n=1 Tax=viral metagenome TaxID=1070528 RepID=A0A6C0E7E6_9ZZZZ
MYFIRTCNDDNVYKTGLNINMDGIYLYPFKNIEYYYMMHHNNKDASMRIAYISTNDCKKIIDYDFYGNYIKVCKCILSKRYVLSDIKTIKKFNLKITEAYIDNLCKIGKISTLQYLYKNKKIKECSPGALGIASEYSKVAVLEWWKKSGLPLKYSEEPLDWASEYGNVVVLEWWFNSGLELKYSENALNRASKNGYLSVLEWWKNSGLELKYSQNALNRASYNGHVDVLEWWKNSGLELKYDNPHNCSINVLEWWVTQ